jgi:hypothetical protein
MVAGLEDGDTAAVEMVFEANPLPAGPYRVGPFLLESWTLPHYVLNAGIRLIAPGLIVAQIRGPVVHEPVTSTARRCCSSKGSAASAATPRPRCSCQQGCSARHRALRTAVSNDGAV